MSIDIKEETEKELYLQNESPDPDTSSTKDNTDVQLTVGELRTNIHAPETLEVQIKLNETESSDIAYDTVKTPKIRTGKFFQRNSKILILKGSYSCTHMLDTIGSGVEKASVDSDLTGTIIHQDSSSEETEVATVNSQTLDMACTTVLPAGDVGEGPSQAANEKEWKRRASEEQVSFRKRRKTQNDVLLDVVSSIQKQWEQKNSEDTLFADFVCKELKHVRDFAAKQKLKAKIMNTIFIAQSLNDYEAHSPSDTKEHLKSEGRVCFDRCKTMIMPKLPSDNIESI